MIRVEVEKVPRIAGGFVLLPVADLMGAWRACRSRPLGIGDFRAYLAMHEMVARRARAGAGRGPTYAVAELARLMGVVERRARASVRRLERARLVAWDERAVVFPNATIARPGPEDSIGRGRGAVVLPRRMLRFLASGRRPALIATTLGIALRCLSRRRDGFGPRGRVKASWVARTFGVGLRQAKAARAELVALGWIAAGESDQWSMNRWGRAYRVDLAWKPPGPAPAVPTPTSPACSTSAPPPAVVGTTSAPPDLQTRNPSGGEKNQEPAGRGPGTGARPGRQEGPTPTASTPLPAPTLDDVRPEDLADVGRALALHRQAVDRGLASPSEDGRLRFVALAEHARAVGTTNAPGLFASLLRRGLYRYATQADEDRAQARLKAHRASPVGPGGAGVVAPGIGRPAFDLRRFGVPKVAAPQGSLSDDARLVREVRSATMRAGVFRDPFPAVNARDPGWTRGRWDAAMAELGL